MAPMDENMGQDETFGQKWGPLIGQGVGLAGGIYASRWAQNAAQQRSPEELASLGGAMGAAGDLRGTGQSILNESRPYIAQPASYYQTLLRGNRAAMANATSAPRADINATYRGAQSNIARAGLRGAARDVQAGQLNRDRATSVAKLTTGVQPYAADALGKLGTQQQGIGVQAGIGAGNIYANLLNQGERNRAAAMAEGGETGKAAGKLLADLGTTAFGGKKKAGAPAVNPYDPNNPKSGYGKPYDPATYGRGGMYEPPPPPPYATPQPFDPGALPGAIGTGDWRPSDTNGWDDPAEWT